MREAAKVCRSRDGEQQLLCRLTLAFLIMSCAAFMRVNDDADVKRLSDYIVPSGPRPMGVEHGISCGLAAGPRGPWTDPTRAVRGRSRLLLTQG